MRLADKKEENHDKEKMSFLHRPSNSSPAEEKFSFQYFFLFFVRKER
jgi:hypothetical protein